MPHFFRYVPYMLIPVAVCYADSERIQSRDAKWKTIKTAHYNIHFPANPTGNFETFAREVASKIEGIHTEVVEWVGYEKKGSTDVLIIDPIMEANGATVPVLNQPLVLLFKTTPEPDSGIGHFNDWVDLLVTHELAHLHHLARPRDGRESRLKNNFLPVGPITINAPRLVIEGYATLVEGRITGSGRPHSAYRSAVIRQWALQGRLPGYESASLGGGFRGGQMAYLLGSAYLEWLERQNPQEPDILKTFWKKLVSKKKRSYDETFKATFGIDPESSYFRWRAEVTHDAIAFEQKVKADGLIREGEVVARFDSEIRDLALSPDGTKLLARVITEKKPGIRIWDLKAEPKPDKKKSIKEDKEDPNEVKDRKPEFIEPKILTVIGKRNGIMPRHAWWTGDDQVTFELRLPNKEGVLKPSFFVSDLKANTIKPAKMPIISGKNEYNWKDIDGVWNIVKKLPDGREQQVTRVLSAAWQPTPSPDGKTLYYVQLTATGCEIRKLDLTQPELESASMSIPENLMIRGTIISEPDAQSLLPPPSSVVLQAKEYSVFDSHKMDDVGGYANSPSNLSFMAGLGGSDVLGRLNWYVAGAIGAARGPRGSGAGVMYRGWRFAPSLQAFYSLEKPSAQKYESIYGFDRDRVGAELAITWTQKGMTPAYLRPFMAWETVKNIDANLDGNVDTKRYLAGLTAGFAKQWSRGEWGIGMNASLQGAFGSTDFSATSNSDNGTNWNIARLDAGLIFKTPAGQLKISAEEGRLNGDYSPLDAFRLGGQNTGLVPDTLEINRFQQPAMPEYIQMGDRARRLRAGLGSIGQLYYERIAVWSSQEPNIEYQNFCGLELRLHELVESASLPTGLGIPSISKFTIGVHRPLEGFMKDKAKNNLVWTINISLAL